jgi:cytochrome c553
MYTLWMQVGVLVLAAGQDGAPSEEQIRFFESRVRPLLADRCVGCHGPRKQKSGLRLDSLAGMLQGGKAGPAVVPGKPERSLLVTAVRYRDADLRMPPDEKLPERDVEDLARWVAMGAPHPERISARMSRRSSVDVEAGRKHWAFRAPVLPELPPASAGNPIDAFVDARLRAQGIRPLGRADRITLLRRATFDLIGLPPTPEEIEDFLADLSPEAYGRVVDRLLSSPHYGERWGRHWLDIARYADSNGMDENLAHGNAWKYRDYVVRSLNADKPYDRFLVEQLAGDLLDAEGDVARRHENLIATGFLALGPKVLAEVDEAKMEMDIVDEQIDSVGRGLLGLTLGCARCHDHKFDPIGQDDYYGLAGIFKSTRTMENFKKIARWYEHSLASSDDLARKAGHDRLVDAKKKEIADLEKKGTEEAKKALKADLKKLQEAAPVMPSAMGASEGVIADAAIHVRGSHLTLGDTVPRRFPRVLAPDAAALSGSGRLAFARWLTSPGHPLTARVMVNRVWRWHFGRGLVPTVDNFGFQGQPPTHPELLDWLAVTFVRDGFSLKALHRRIMTSEVYQRSGGADLRALELDPENRLHWRRDVRRLEAEAIRDSMLAVSGTLDRTFGGSLLTVKNREFLFDHTSKDRSTYDVRRRSIYLPVIRNHLYDLFQLFDSTDATVLSGDRATSTVSPQALFLMNSDWVASLSAAMAARLIKAEPSREARLSRLFREAYGRTPSEEESRRMLRFVEDGRTPEAEAWQSLCQAILSSSEFIYVR